MSVFTPGRPGTGVRGTASRLGVGVLSGALLLLVVGLVGCRSYQRGSLMHPQVKSVGVEVFQNLSEEPALGPVFRRKLAEQFMTDGSLKVKDTSDVDAVVRGRILHARYDETARVKSRDKNARSNERAAYQAAVFQAEVEVEYDVVVPGRERPLVSVRHVTGKASFSRMPDLVVPRQDALAQALNDAAIRIVADVTEAW